MVESCLGLRRHRFSQDRAGWPGPATWELGDFVSGQGNYPVGGVSWYEALVYCRSQGKMLPSVFHWGESRVVSH